MCLLSASRDYSRSALLDVYEAPCICLVCITLAVGITFKRAAEPGTGIGPRAC